jgi:hypothetical protein
MIPIPGEVIAALTFPGVIVHEAAHMLFCRLRHVAVLDVCYFRFGNPAGYVVHEPSESFTTAFLISMGPFFVNSLLCIAICLPVFVPVRIFGRQDPLSLVLLWLGLSIGMNAIPSTQDASSLWTQARKAAGRLNPLALLTLPLVVVVYVANLARFFWADLLYGVAIGLLLPQWVWQYLMR